MDLQIATLSYIRIEVVAFFFTLVLQFLIVLLVSTNKWKSLLWLSVTKISLIIGFDLLLLIYFELGVNALGYSNLFINVVLITLVYLVLYKSNAHFLALKFLNLRFVKYISNISVISGLESALRNVCYIVMVLSMINSVKAQGSFWIVQGFIWGWLLFPILSLGEIIKNDASLHKINLIYYFRVTSIIVLLWLFFLPFYGQFFKYVLHVGDNYEDIMITLNILLPFYIIFAYGNIFSSIFYGAGKLYLVLYQSCAVNILLYGTFFLLYQKQIYVPTLNNITYLFACSLLMSSIINAVVFYIKRPTFR